MQRNFSVRVRAGRWPVLLLRGLLGLSLIAGFLVTQVAHVPAARASVGDCDGGTITTRASAFAFVANHYSEFVGLRDALTRLGLCGYTDVDALETSLKADNDVSLAGANLLPASRTDIDGMAAEPNIDFTSSCGNYTACTSKGANTVIDGAMYRLHAQYDAAGGTGGVQSRQDMLDLMRAQSRMSGSWTLPIFYQKTAGAPGTTTTLTDKRTMDGADFKDWADPAKFAAAYDKVSADGTVAADLQKWVLWEVNNSWVDSSSRQVVSARIASQVSAPEFAKWLNGRPTGMYALVARDQVQTMMYGLGVLDQVLGTHAVDDAQQALLANSVTVAFDDVYAAAHGRSGATAVVSDNDLRNGFTGTIELFRLMTGVSGLVDAANDLNNDADKAYAAAALRAVGWVDPAAQPPSQQTLYDLLRNHNIPVTQSTKFAKFLYLAGRLGLFATAMNLSSFGAAISRIRQGQTGTPLENLTIARGMLSLASTSESFLLLGQALKSGLDRNTMLAIGLGTDFKVVWGPDGKVGSKIIPTPAPVDSPRAIAQITIDWTTAQQAQLDAPLVARMTPAQSAAAVDEAAARLSRQIAATNNGVAPDSDFTKKVVVSTIKLFAQTAGFAANVLDIVLAAMTLAKGSATVGAKGLAVLSLLSGVAGTAAATLALVDGVIELPFAVGAWALGFTVIAAVLFVVVGILAWVLAAQNRVNAARDAAYTQWTRWSALGIMRPDWAARYDYAMYSLAPYSAPSGLLGYGGRDAPVGTSYFVYQKAEFDHFAATYVRSAVTYWSYLDRSLHRGCTTGCASAPVTPAGTAKVMVVGDSISNGFQGDYTWRYRLWQWAQQQAWPVQFVGPYTGTDNAETPHAPVPPALQGAATPLSTLPDLKGGYAKDINTAFTTPVTGQAGGVNVASSHFAVWGRQVNQDKDQIKPIITTLDASSQKPDILLVELGFNDLGWFVSDDVGTLRSMKTFVDNARAANPNIAIVIANVPQRTSLGASRADLPVNTRKYNSALAQAIPTWSTAGSPIALADFDQAYGCDPSATTCASTYDGLHPNALGEYRIAHAFEAALHGSMGIGSTVPAVPAASNVPARPTGTPTNLRFDGTQQGVSATWDPVYGTHDYEVEWRDLTANPVAAWPSPAVTSFARWDKSWQFDGGPVDGHTYEVRVRASAGDDDGLKSAWSASVQGVAHPTTAPPPTNITTVPTTTGLDVTWKAPTGANTGSMKQYALWVYDQNVPGSYAQVLGLPLSSSSTHVDGLVSGDRYTVIMDTWNAAGEGPASIARPVVVGGGMPAAPGNLAVQSVDPTTVNLTWAASAGASGYRVWVRNVNDATSVSKADDNIVSGTSTGIAYLFPGVWNYEFCITAINGTLESAKSTCVVAPRPAGS